MSTNKPHIHADLIKAWADGAIIEKAVFGALSGELLRWEEQKHPYWNEDAKYRVKPEPKPDVVRYWGVSASIGYETLKEAEQWNKIHDFTQMVKLTFDGDNPIVLKSLEYVKEVQ